MSIIGDPSADVVISQQMWINITSEAERLAAMAKECAAERDALRARVSELEAAGRAVLNCNDQVCAFGHGGCPAQCRADEMLRKAIRCAGNKPASLPEGT